MYSNEPRAWQDKTLLTIIWLILLSKNMICGIVNISIPFFLPEFRILPKRGLGWIFGYINKVDNLNCRDNMPERCTIFSYQQAFCFGYSSSNCLMFKLSLMIQLQYCHSQINSQLDGSITTKTHKRIAFTAFFLSSNLWKSNGIPNYFNGQKFVNV